MHKYFLHFHTKFYASTQVNSNVPVFSTRIVSVFAAYAYLADACKLLHPYVRIICFLASLYNADTVHTTKLYVYVNE